MHSWHPQDTERPTGSQWDLVLTPLSRARANQSQRVTDSQGSFYSESGPVEIEWNLNVKLLPIHFHGSPLSRTDVG